MRSAGKRSVPRPNANLVLLGEFGRPHGLKGVIRLKSYTEDPLAIGRYGVLSGEDGRSFVVAHLRRAAGDQPDLLVARLDGVATREAAEALNRTRLFVPRERLGQPEDEDEFFLADLVGLEVRDPSGAALGRVVGVPDFGSGQLLEIAPASGPTVLVPFTKAFVPRIDLASRHVVVVPPVDAADDEDAGGADGQP